MLKITAYGKIGDEYKPLFLRIRKDRVLMYEEAVNNPRTPPGVMSVITWLGGDDREKFTMSQESIQELDRQIEA